jgi:solute carrier family 6 amino acid/orphan transporter-like 15/16/17/18/20
LSIYIFFIFADRFGGASKLGSGEDKQVFRPEGDEDDTELWDSKLTFLLATVGTAVGFGNVWLFP